VMHQKQKENLRKLFKVSVHSSCFVGGGLRCIGYQDSGVWRGVLFKKPVVTVIINYALMKSEFPTVLSALQTSAV
jgi:hypothetical protein